MSKRINIKDYVEFWRNLPLEIKPLPSTIQFWEDKIQEILQQNKNPRALVLGVTPEIRDLLAKYKINTICLDINPIMIKAMALIIKRKNFKEKIIVGNWLKMPFKENSFDLVLSDCPQDNLAFQKWDSFFENVSRVLKSGGYWLLGATYFKGFKEGISLIQFIKSYRKNPKMFKNSSWKFYYILKLSSHREFYNRESRVVDWTLIDKKLKQLYEDWQISKKELDDLRISTEKLKLSLLCQWTWATLNEFHNFFKRHYFYILGYREDDVFPAGYFRQAFILKKK